MTIAAVSYLNTIPFLYGLRHSDELAAELLLSPPRGCVEAFADGRADIALVPVGGLADLGEYDIVSDWCIGASGPVRTVVMVSDAPLKEIRRVWLDGHSRTSVELVKQLAKRWKIKPAWTELKDYEALNNPIPGDAFVLIGDKVFGAEGKFKHSWDLAQEWLEQEKLPFVFAVWVARKGLDPAVLAAFQEALTLGVERVYESILESDYRDFPDAYDYLTRNIDYFFDEPKRRAMALFLKPAAL